MKKILKIVLTVAFVAGSTSVFAQKLGRINMQELVFAMPETAEMQKNLEAYQKELQDQLETIGVEFNNKLNEYTKQVSDKNSTMSDSVRQLKEKELNDLKTRYDEFVQVSQQDMQKKQGELLEPIIVKAQDAVKEVSKAGGYTVVYDTSVNAVAYFDEAVVTDILPAVKTKLGIKDTPAAAPAAPAPKTASRQHDLRAGSYTDPPRSLQAQTDKPRRQPFGGGHLRSSGDGRCGLSVRLRPDESQQRFGRSFRLLQKSHVSRIGEPHHLCLRMGGSQLLGDRGGNVFILAAEDEELPHGRTAQHLVAVGASDHPVEKRHDPVVLRKIYLFGQIRDGIGHPLPVVGGESGTGRNAGQLFLLAGPHERDFAAAILALLLRVGVRRRREEHQTVEHFRMTFAKGQRHVAAHRMSHERTARDTERLQRIADDVGQILHRVALAPYLRNAVPRQVERHDPHPFVQQRDEIVPHEHRFQIAMQQYDASFALLRIANVQGRPPCHNKLFDHR